MVLCAGMLATSLAGLLVKQGIEQDALRYFGFAYDQVTVRIQDRLAANVLALQGGAALFARTGTVSRKEWRAYFDSLGPSQGIRGAQGIGFIKAVPEDWLGAHIAGVRAEGFPDYTVHPQGKRSFYAPVALTEPFRGRNTRALGFDMFSDPQRRAAMERARDSGKATRSSRVALLATPGEKDQAGVLLFVPVYRNDMPVTTDVQRSAALIGWVYSIYRMTEFMNDFLEKWQEQNTPLFNLKIYDGHQANSAELLYESEPGGGTVSDSHFHQQRVINFYGQPWLLAYDRSNTGPGLHYGPVWVVLAGGFALSGLVFALLLSLRNTSARADRIADNLTRELRASEQLLRECEHRWKFAVQSSGDVIWDKDLEKNTSFRSAGWKQLLGYAENELGEGTGTWQMHIHPEERPRVATALYAFLEGKADSYTLEYRVVCKDGSHKWIFSRSAVVAHRADGRPARVIGTHSDITARRQAEQSLRLARISIDAAYDALFWATADTRIVDVNEAACRLYGYTREELLQLKISDINPGNNLRPGIWAERFAEIGRRGSMKFETTHRTKDGRFIEVEVAANRVVLDGKDFNCAFVRDITARKLAETALQAAIASADKANRAKSRFLAAASHDLRQPLAALSLYVGTLKSQPPPGSEGVLGNIGECVNSLNELLADLLDVSKLEAGVVTPSPTEFAMDDFLGRLVSIHTAEAKLKGLHLRLRRSDLGAHTDAQLLQRIIGNLLSNAIRYTQTGGVLIACRRHQGKHWVEVWDTGCGIAGGDIEIIFEEFRQLGDSARNRGSGLGLAIVAKSAALLGLQIRVCSRPGRGSMFAVELPEGRAIETTQQQPARPAARSLTIGLVEDHSQVRCALTLALETAGHVVFPASSGAELLAELGDQAPDVVIADYRLADSETGFEAIAAVRAIYGARLPAIVITGDTDPDLIRDMARQDIAVHYKPLQLDALETFLRKATDLASN
jgi:PAS domain S-box-containing protein